MSVQTGRPAVADAVPGSTRIERAALSVRRIRNDPNPIWMRELRQSARLTRTPIILATITGIMALLICSIGGIAAAASEPAAVGSILFHVFFSLAFAVVTWVGPAVAATTIASERGGRTWEALILTGVGANTIAQGKFLSAMTYISMYIIMLAPVGALPFLFGGISATEVVAAFALLLLFAVLSVAFGLSLSSKFSSSAAAITVTLLVTIVLSSVIYVVGGPLLSIAAHEMWPTIPEGPPVWLPTAYVRADFGLEYIAFLVLLPLACVALPAWLLYELTVANMKSVSDDRSTGLRKWFLVAAPILTIVSIAAPAAAPSDRWKFSVAGMGALAVFYTVMAFIFAGEPLGPSRRVQVHWDRRNVSGWTRYLGPGILKASSLLLILGIGSFVLQILAGVTIDQTLSRVPKTVNAERIIAFGGYAAAFFVFIVGFTAWSRARAQSSTAPRLLLFGALFVAMLGPWIVAAITGALASAPMDNAMVIASPSPIYVFGILDELSRPGREAVVLAGAICAAAWAVLGLGLLAAGRSRVRKVVAEHRARVAEMERALLDEDGTTKAPEPTEGEPPVDDGGVEAAPS